MFIFPLPRGTRTFWPHAGQSNTLYFRKSPNFCQKFRNPFLKRYHPTKKRLFSVARFMWLRESIRNTDHAKTAQEARYRGNSIKICERIAIARYTKNKKSDSESAPCLPFINLLSQSILLPPDFFHFYYTCFAGSIQIQNRINPSFAERKKNRFKRFCSSVFILPGQLWRSVCRLCPYKYKAQPLWRYSGVSSASASGSTLSGYAGNYRKNEPSQTLPKQP